MSPFIPDGYTRTTTIEPSDGHPSVTLEYRRMLPTDRAALRRRVKALEPAGEAGVVIAERILMEELARRIVSWSLCDESDSLRRISVSCLEQIEMGLLESLLTTVLDLEPGDDREDAEDERNLREGVRLLASAPWLAVRDCGDCEHHVYDERTGRRTMHAGRPVVRPVGTCAPCRLPHVGCLKGTPETSKALSPKNLQAYRHYRECRAVGAFPDDPIVKRNAATIRAAELEREPGPTSAKPPERRSAL